MKRSQGVTLVELMVTVAVLAIIAMIAVPEFREMTARQRIHSTTNDLVTAVHFARSEAIRRGATVVMCKSSDGSICKTTANDWEVGWIVFVDTNGNDNRDNGEEIVRAWPARAGGITVRPNNSNTNTILRFNGRGEMQNLGAGGMSFRICAPGIGAEGRSVVLTRLRPATEPFNGC